MKKMIYLLILIMLISGCNNKEKEMVMQELYHYSGEVISLVNKHGKIIKPYDMKLNYVMNFFPTERIFNTYNDVYSEDVERFIEITDNTAIYILDGNKKTLAQASDLTNGLKVAFWIKPHPKSTSFVEAIEINILK